MAGGVTALLLAGLTVLPDAGRSASAEEPQPPDVGVVVTDGYAVGSSPDSGPFGSRDIFVHRNGETTRVTHNVYDAENDYHPSSHSPTLSPDGSRIAYVHCREEEWFGGMRARALARSEVCSIWTMNVDGSGAAEANDYFISDRLGSYIDLDWGPTGEVAYVYDGELRAFVPGGAHRVVSNSPTQYWGDPSWAPEGDRLVVTAQAKGGFGAPEGKTDLVIIGADGSAPVDVTNTSDQWEDTPRWSDDGSLIAYAGQTEFGDAAVFHMASDGTEKTEVFYGFEFLRDIVPAGWSTGSTFLGLLSEDTEGVRRFGVVPVTNDRDVAQVFELPAGGETVDWVGAVDSPPVAQDQEVTVPSGGQVTFTLVATDADDDPITYTLLTEPQHGTLTGTPPELTYRPADDYEGPDALTFRATAKGKSSDATVSITVTPACTEIGTGKNDVLRGTAGNDVLCGLGGNDVLLGFGGKDVMYGGAGDDDLVGGPGDDTLDGGAGNDGLRGEGGTDEVIGGEGRDTVSFFKATGGAVVDLATQTGRAPGHGADVISGTENAFGTAYADTLTGDNGFNQLYGGLGNDVLRGGGDADLLDGGKGKDTLEGGTGPDSLNGGPDADRLKGGPGSDVCYYDEDGGRLTSCENPDKKAARTVGASERAAGRIVVAGAPLGNNDYLWVYDPAATQSLQLKNYSTSDWWEKAVCQTLRRAPAVKSACSADNALQAMSKRRVEWFLDRAAAWNACGIFIMDYGRHGINQFKKRWKVRAADNYFNHVAEAWVTPGGQVSEIEISDPDEVNGWDYYTVTC